MFWKAVGLPAHYTPLQHPVRLLCARRTVTERSPLLWKNMNSGSLTERKRHLFKHGFVFCVRQPVAPDPPLGQLEGQLFSLL